MPFSISDDKFIIFIATIFAVIFSFFFLLSFPPIGYVLPVILAVCGSVMFFGGFLIFDALRMRKQYLPANTGAVIALGGFIVLVGFGILWFIYFVDWD
jgi:hypothetical protein